MNEFSIEYPEYHIAHQLQKDFPKASNFSVSIPLSRQQKYYDLLLHNSNNRLSLTIQVKSSRTYINTDINRKELKDYNYQAWLTNFQNTNPFTDFYFIYISYPIFDTITFKPKATSGIKILVFDKVQMTLLLSRIKITKSGKPDKFFGFGFNINSNRIFSTRGFTQDSRREFTDNDYQNKVSSLRQAIA